MEPLASLNGLVPYSGLGLPGTVVDADRDAPAFKARGKERPVQLLPDRVDEGELPTQPPPPRPQDAGDESTSSLRIGVPAGSEPETENDARAAAPRESVDLSNAAVQTPREAVTYRLYPDLVSSIQSRVVDRRTDEILRATPSDARIELAQRFQEYRPPVGTQIDLDA